MTHAPAPNPIVSRWRRLGVRTRLMLMHMTLMTVVIGAVVAQSDHSLTARLNTQFNRDLTEEGAEFTNAAAIRPHGQSLPAFTRFYLDTHLRPSSLAWIIALNRPAGGQDVLTSRGLAPTLTARLTASMLGPTAPAKQLSNVNLSDGHYRAYATPIFLSGRRVATLVAVRSLAHLDANRNSELMVAVLEGLAALVASVLAGYLLVGRVLRVVGRVQRTAERAASGDLSLRVDYEGPDDEVGRLARTVDTMLGRIDRAFSAQRRLLSDVSHQLRTPLTVIRGHLEVLARNPEADAEERGETIALVIDEVEHVSLMVERLLLLGRALEPDFVEEEPVDVRSLLEDVFDAAEFLAPRHWELDAGPPLVISADRTKLRGALLNLLDNAVKATGEQDTIRLSARHDGELILEVADTGRGLSSAQQSRLFERFSRSSDSYRGSGLGLAIVKAVAEAHGGRVQLESAPGEGARFRIVLPKERIVTEVPRRPETQAVAG
ncbi:MAG: sensor histidine kinase [Solirubrobacteraceae bacterium]